MAPPDFTVPSQASPQNPVGSTLADSKALQNHFYSHYDPTVGAELSHSDRLLDRMRPAGAGTHFEVYQWVTPSGGRLACKILRGERYEEVARPGWIKALQVLQNHPLTLIPPMEWALNAPHQRFVLFMPFGEHVLSPDQQLNGCWLPFAPHLQQLSHKLRGLGLGIADHLQISHWQGIPFVHDLSDLHPL